MNKYADLTVDKQTKEVCDISTVEALDKDLPEKSKAGGVEVWDEAAELVEQKHLQDGA